MSVAERQRSRQFWRRASSLLYDDSEPLAQEKDSVKVAVWALLMFVPPSALAGVAVVSNGLLSLVSSSRLELPDAWHYFLWQLVCWLSVLVLLLWPKGELIGTRTLKRVVLTPMLGKGWKKPLGKIRVSTILTEEAPKPPSPIAPSPPPQPAQAAESREEETQTSNPLIHDPSLAQDLQYLNLIPEMVKDFSLMAMPEQNSASEDARWTLLVDDSKSHPPLKQWKLEQSGDSLCIKLVGVMDGDAQTLFNACMDERLRPEWDEMIEESKQLDMLSPKGHDRVIYVKTKAVFPTASRDLVLLAHTFASPHPQYQNITRYANVTRSIEHPSCPVRSGVVRIRAGVAGIMVEPLLDANGDPIPNKCRVMQLADTSLGGNIPGWLVKRVVGTVLPNVFRKLAACVEREAKLNVNLWDHFLGQVIRAFPDNARLELLKRRDGDVTAVSTPVQSTVPETQEVATRVDALKLLELQFKTLETRMRVLEMTSTIAKKHVRDYSGLVSVAASVFVVGWHIGTRLKGWQLE